jgi:hypothetical protein
MPLMTRFVSEFQEALESELEPLVDLPVYRDDKRLQGGDFFNEALAKGLCESVCMIMVFAPTYFSPDHTYCTREYLAMKQLEARRLREAAQPQRTLHGLIIPVVLRGFDKLPAEILSQRNAYRFERFAPSQKKLITSRWCEQDVPEHGKVYCSPLP